MVQNPQVPQKSNLQLLKTKQSRPRLNRHGDARHPIRDSHVSACYLNTEIPPLCTSTALKAIFGKPRATHSSARRMDLWVTTRWQDPSANRMSADTAMRHT